MKINQKEMKNDRENREKLSPLSAILTMSVMGHFEQEQFLFSSSFIF